MTDPLQGPEQPDDDIQQVRAALEVLDLERHRLVARLEQLQRAAVSVSAVAPASVPAPAKPGISNNSSSAEKIAVFR